MDSPCTLIQRQIGDLFQCAPHGKFVRIRTPFLYPDGDVIDLFLAVPPDGGASGADPATLTDLGETVRWLRMQTTTLRRSPRQDQILEDIRLTSGVELYRGMLQVRCRPQENLAEAVVRLSQAAVRASDLWFTFRNRAVESAADVVADLFNEQKIDFTKNVTIKGRSDRTWNISFHTRTPRRSSLVQVLSTSSRSAGRRLTNQAVAAWYDLNRLKVSPEALHFVSLFDDTSDVWEEENFRQVEDLSEVARLSDPDGLVRILQAA